MDALGSRQPRGGLLPLGGLAWGMRGGAAFVAVALVRCERVGVPGMIAPRLAKLRQRLVGRRLTCKTLCLSVQEWSLHGVICLVWRLPDSGLGSPGGGLGKDHQPALGHALVASLQALRACLGLDIVPGVDRTRLGQHLRHHCEGVGNAGDTRHGLEGLGSVLLVALAVCHPIPGGWRVLQRLQQRLGPFVEDCAIGRMAIPALAEQRHPTVLRDHQLQDGLLHIRTVIFSLARRDGHGVCIALGPRVAREGTTCGVERVDALVAAFVSADGHRHFAQHQVAALGVPLIEATAERKAVDHLRCDTLTQQQVERGVGKTRWGERHGTMGKPQAVADHPGDRFASGDLFLLMDTQACVEPLDDAQVFAHRSDHSSMVQTFNADGCHRQPSALHRDESIRSAREGI